MNKKSSVLNIHSGLNRGPNHMCRERQLERDTQSTAVTQQTSCPTGTTVCRQRAGARRCLLRTAPRTTHVVPVCVGVRLHGVHTGGKLEGRSLVKETTRA
jgi:hypothetical protein